MKHSKEDGHSEARHLEIILATILAGLSALETILGAGSAIVILGEALKIWDWL